MNYSMKMNDPENLMSFPLVKFLAKNRKGENAMESLFFFFCFVFYSEPSCVYIFEYYDVPFPERGYELKTFRFFCFRKATSTFFYILYLESFNDAKNLKTTLYMDRYKFIVKNIEIEGFLK